jgi:hypothetical protein
MTAGSTNSERRGAIVRYGLVICLLASVVANAELAAQLLRRPPPADPRPSPVAAADSAPPPPAAAARPQPLPAACRQEIATLDEKIAQARSALQALRPEELFRQSPLNRQATAELKAPLEAALRLPLDGAGDQRLECRGLLCRLDLRGIRQSRGTGAALYEAARRGQLGRVDPDSPLALSEGSHATVDPGTRERRFSTTYWIRLLDARPQVPANVAPAGGGQ